MNVETYTLAQQGTFLVLPEGAAPPDRIDMTGAKPFKRLTLARGQQRVAMDTDEVLDDLAAQGWAVVGARVVSS